MNTFADKLKKKMPSLIEFDKTLSDLTNIRDGLAKIYNNLIFEIKLGEWNQNKNLLCKFITKVQPDGVNFDLFGIYVPQTGYPVQLQIDMMSSNIQKQPCRDKEEMENQIIERLGEINTVTMLDMLQGGQSLLLIKN